MEIGPEETSPMMGYANRSKGMSSYGPMTCGIGAPKTPAPSVTTKHVSTKGYVKPFEGADPADREFPKDSVSVANG